MSLNKRGAVITNVHQSFVVTAMKMHAYLQHLGRLGGGTTFGLKPNLKKRKGHVQSGLALKAQRTSEGNLLLSTSHPSAIRVVADMELGTGVIRQVIRYTYSSVRNGSNSSIAEKAGAVCTLQQDVVTWCVGDI